MPTDFFSLWSSLSKDFTVLDIDFMVFADLELEEDLSSSSSLAAFLRALDFGLNFWAHCFPISITEVLDVPAGTFLSLAFMASGSKCWTLSQHRGEI